MVFQKTAGHLLNTHGSTKWSFKTAGLSLTIHESTKWSFIDYPWIHNVVIQDSWSFIGPKALYTVFDWTTHRSNTNGKTHNFMFPKCINGKAIFYLFNPILYNLINWLTFLENKSGVFGEIFTALSFVEHRRRRNVLICFIYVGFFTLSPVF